MRESIEDVDPSTESWLFTEVADAYDSLKADPSRAIPSDVVRAHFEDKWMTRP